MAERNTEQEAGSSDCNNGRLKNFCESFVKNFEKKFNEIKEEATVGVKTGTATTNHRDKSILIYYKLRPIKDDKDFRKMLISAAGEIFWCFQNQFMLVTDRRNMVPRGMEKLANDGVSRLFDYISSTKNKKINCKTFCEFITEGIILGKSKTRNMIKYQNNKCYTSELYEDVGILENNRHESKKYYNRKGSPCTFSYRFSLSWETFKKFSVKKYASSTEPTINCDLTKDVLKQQLENILKIINREDLAWDIKETTKNTTNILKKVSEIKNIYKKEVTKNDKLKTNPVWFDMREPVVTYTGRTEVLQKLHRILQNAAGSAVISQTTCVSGLGGIGKSELSRNYAIKYQKAYDRNLIWINSETQDSLKDSFTRLAKKLKIPIREKVAEKIEKKRDVASIADDIYKHFGNGKCLFIFDNAEEYEIIKEFLPFSLHSQKPHILITSRNQDWNLADTGDVCVINLQYFTSKESLDFIKNALKILTENNSSDDELKDLGDQLGNFPLALGQAVAYIQMKNITAEKYGRGKFKVRDYLKEYQDESLKLLKHHHRNSQYNKTVLTTWNITLKNIKEENEDSMKIIEIMAYLVPDSELIKDHKMREGATDLLVKYSMITIKDGVFSIHRLVLVQEVIRFHLKDKSREKDVLEDALELLGFHLSEFGNSNLLSVWSYACDHGQIIDKFFFKYKSDGIYKQTLLHLFVESDAIEIVKKILTHFKKKWNKRLQQILNYVSNLSISIKRNNLEMVKLLIEFGGIKNTNTCAQSIFHGNVDLAKYLYPKNDEYLLNAKFYSALQSKDVKSLVNLLEKLTYEQIQNIFEQKLTNLDPNFITHRPPLHYAARVGNLEIVKLFLKYKANVNIRTYYDRTLHTAVEGRNYEIFKFLIDNGANYNTVNRFGETVLHCAAREGQLEMVKYLIINNKCDINATNKRCETALDLATRNKYLEVIEYLTKIMAERNTEQEAESSDCNNGRLKNFCESFVKNFEKKFNEIKEEATVEGKKGTSTNHREESILVYCKLRPIKDDKDFRKMLVTAAGEIFWCFQNQFMFVTDRRNMISIGMENLAFDGVSRIFDYIFSKRNKKINCKTFCDLSLRELFLVNLKVAKK